MNKELDGHKCREGKSEYVLCCAECESVRHVCSACSTIRVIFVEKPLEDRCISIDKLDSIVKTAYVLGSRWSSSKGQTDGKDLLVCSSGSGKGGRDGKNLPICTCM